jgi:plasmid stabilization system protein ParE
MTYNIEWVEAAEDDLADIWLRTPDRPAVTAAAAAIDRCLEQDPENEGESRPNGRRIAFFSPLGVRYRVVPGKRAVQVLRVWRF